jgi:6-phosphogluconolactonase
MAPRSFLYVGSYTHESSFGIHVYDSSDPTGLLVERSEVEGIEHPSFLTTHPGGNTLYAVSETASSDGGGLVAFRIDPVDGSLAMIDRASSHGTAPCYVSVDADGRHLYVANYLSGTIAVYTLASDGRFGELVATHQHRGSGPSPRQEGPHAHCILPGPVGDSVYAVDLGTDRVSRYVHDRRYDGDAFVLEDQLVLDAGSGPRHLAFHPDQPVAFLVCELDSTIVTLGLDPTDGRLTRLRSSSTLPDDFTGESIAAEVRVHPNGRRVYASNRGHDSIAVFGFTGPGEPLEPLGHVHSGGQTPRNFAVHPSGRALLVVNQGSNTVVPFEIEASNGALRRLDITYGVSEPVCVTFLEVVR